MILPTGRVKAVWSWGYCYVRGEIDDDAEEDSTEMQKMMAQNTNLNKENNTMTSLPANDVNGTTVHDDENQSDTGKKK